MFAYDGEDDLVWGRDDKGMFSKRKFGALTDRFT